MYVGLGARVILDTWSQRTFSAAREESSSRRPKCGAVAAFHVQRCGGISQRLLKPGRLDAFAVQLLLSCPFLISFLAVVAFSSAL